MITNLMVRRSLLSSDFNDDLDSTKLRALGSG